MGNGEMETAMSLNCVGHNRWVVKQGSRVYMLCKVAQLYTDKVHTPVIWSIPFLVLIILVELSHLAMKLLNIYLLYTLAIGALLYPVHALINQTDMHSNLCLISTELVCVFTEEWLQTCIYHIYIIEWYMLLWIIVLHVCETWLPDEARNLVESWNNKSRI